MKIKQNLRYINRGLSLLIAILFIVTIAATVFLVQTLSNSKALISDGGNAVSSVLMLQDLELNLQTAEASQKNYIITGDPAYLQIYNAAIKRVPLEQKELSAPKYQVDTSELKTLYSLIGQRLTGLKRGIEIRDSQGLNAAATAISSGTVLAQITSIQKLVQNIVQEKFAPFTLSIQQTQNRLHIALYVAFIMIGFVFIISSLIILYFHRAISKERATEGVKNEFLSLASHQLRTPASNVKQYLGLLLEGYLGKLPAKQVEAIEVANKNNEIGINIINDLLDVAKLDLEKIHLNKEQIDIYKLAKEVVEEYRPQLKQRRQTIKFIKPSKKIGVSADPTYMKSVIENLLDNASKYSPKKSRIVIGIDEKSHKKATLSIKDEGVGMKKREMAKLFRKFSRISSDILGNVEGSGLGLYWVKQIVELHGGRVIVKSRHGKGSTFSVELPLH
jgi:signal transduction histidine kinase